MQGVRVQFLVGELRSPMLWSQKKKRTWQYHHNKHFLKSYAVSRSISSTCNFKVWSSCKHSCYLVPNTQTCEGYRLLREFMWIYVPAFATAWLALGSWVQPTRKRDMNHDCEVILTWVSYTKMVKTHKGTLRVIHHLKSSFDFEPGSTQNKVRIHASQIWLAA